MRTNLIFTHALSPLHPGTGQGTGVIDLPIAREKATGLPYLPGSSLKGTLRSACTADENIKKSVFGPDTNGASDHSGSVQFADQRLLLLPIRSLAGTFAWVTSPYVLRRFARDARDVGMKGLPDSIPAPSAPERCHISTESALILTGAKEQQVYLEDLDLTPEASPKVQEWATWLAATIFSDDNEWQQMLAQRLCIVHDDMLSFLLKTATEITARIRLDEQKKTVTKGGLWYEEALPTETILAGLMLIAPPEKADIKDQKVLDVIKGCIGKTLQLGGKATVGRGLCRVTLVEE